MNASAEYNFVSQSENTGVFCWFYSGRDAPFYTTKS